VAYVDDDVIALIDQDLPGVLLAPRSHVEALSGLSTATGDFLAALRRTVTEVQAAYGTTGAMIEPTTDLAGAPGHVCYRVVPTLGDESAGPADVVVEPRRLALALSSH